MAQWLLITSVIFLASTLQSMTGFGFAVLAVPLLVPLLPPRDAVALITLLSTATTVVALVAHPGGDGARVDLASLHCRPLGRAPRPWRVGVAAGRLVAYRRGTRQPARGKRAPVVAGDHRFVWACGWHPTPP